METCICNNINRNNNGNGNYNGNRNGNRKFNGNVNRNVNRNCNRNINGNGNDNGIGNRNRNGYRLTRQHRDPKNTTGNAYCWTYGNTVNDLHTSGVCHYPAIFQISTDKLESLYMAAPLEWKNKEEQICWSRHNL